MMREDLMVQQQVKNLWQHFVGVICLNQTGRIQVKRVLPEFFDKWPTPEAFLKSDKKTVIEVIKSFGAKLIFTLHTPPCSCMGNLLNASHAICKGDLIDTRCTFFRLKTKGIPYLIAKFISYQNGWPFSPNNKNLFSRLLTSRKLTSNMHKSWINLINQVDHIHVLSNWGKDMLIKQKISCNKINLIRTAGPKKLPNKKRLPMEDTFLKLVFWGRCNPEKGLHIVIDAILFINRDFLLFKRTLPNSVLIGHNI